MFESMQIRVLVGIVVVVFGIMLMKFLSGDKEKIVEYKAPARRQAIRSSLKKAASKEKKHVTFAPSPVDATMVPYGDWSTNRNSESGIMNHMNNVSIPTSGAMSTNTNMNMPSALPSIPLLGYGGEDDMFGSDL